MTHLDDGWTAFYALILISGVLQAILLTALVYAAVAWYQRARRRRSGQALRVHEPVAVVVPCYLPNEAPIIMDTITHLLENLDHIDDLTVYMVYNTPRAMPIESELYNMAESWINQQGRKLVVHEVPGSTSKAGNLNYVIPQITADIVAIYDADHHPDPESLALSIWHLRDRQCDCVQGSTYIRQGCYLARLMVQAEFFVNYFVMLPAMQAASGTGLFGGANGIWRTSALQKVQFDEVALTEDIDYFARSIVQHGFRFEFLPESCSGELLPANFRAYWRQRLRWAMGWDQLCALIIVVFNVCSAIQWHLVEYSDNESGLKAPTSVVHLQVASFYAYCILICYTLVRVAIHKLPLLPGVVLYFICLPMYVLFNSMLMIVSLVRVSFGITGEWVVTSRAHRLAKIDQERGVESHVPLLGLKTASYMTIWVLMGAFTTQGALVGALVGYIVGQHREQVPLWGWVPFGIGSTTITVVDGNVVDLYMGAGVLVGLFFLWATVLLQSSYLR